VTELFEKVIELRLARLCRAFMRNPVQAAEAARFRLGLKLRRRFKEGPFILFQRHAGMGDIICTFPAVAAIRKQYPTCHLIYSTWEMFAPIVRMSRLADTVVELDWRGDIQKIVRREFDLVYEPWLEDEAPKGRPADTHLVDEFASIVGVTLTDRQPRMYLEPHQSEKVREFRSFTAKSAKPIIGIHIGPSWRVREWTVEGWTKLVEMLSKALGATVIQFGADRDTAKGPVEVPRVRGSVDMVGRFNLAESVAAMAECSLFVGIDSGLLHVCGAIGVPCVGIFGAVDPNLRLPPTTPSRGVVADVPCIGCHHRRPKLHWQHGCPMNIQCMLSVRPEDVCEACLDLLSVPDKRRERQVEEARS
jgi:ADP-heptose:LPS heptosyltransferase